MDQRTDSTVILIGGPDAGKTNFIGRFWISIDAHKGMLVKDGNPKDLVYLQNLATKLLQGHFAPHTSRDEPPNMSSIPIKLKQPEHPFRGNLIIPDCSGEEWLGVYKKREWYKEWEDLISDSCGCLIFLRADSNQITPMLDWMSCASLFTQREDSSVDHIDGERDTEVTPTEIILIDWMQCLQRVFVDRVKRAFRPRIGVVITAWDLIPHDQGNIGPQGYLAENFPMLHQFMEANAERACFSTFGVSVAGGDLDADQGFRESYLDASPQDSGYVYYTAEGVTKHSPDVTLPVAWAMGLTDI